jgi:hypothetical protein
MRVLRAMLVLRVLSQGVVTMQRQDMLLLNLEQLRRMRG